MHRAPSIEEFGEPDLRLEGLCLWVHARAGATEPDEDGWLRVSANCSGNGSSVWTQGEILRLSGLVGFGLGCARLLAGSSSDARLVPPEDELRIDVFRSDAHGHLQAHVRISADPTRERHEFEFALDVSYLPAIVAACERIARAFGGPQASLG